MSPITHLRRFPVFHRFVLVILVMTFPAALSAQTKPNKAERREQKVDAGSATAGKPSSNEAQSRVLAKLRGQLEVTDDAEWDIIMERITRVTELRRDVSIGAAAFRGPPSFGDKNKRSVRSGASLHPEQDALRVALSDKLPDAEIKARLARVHDVYLQNEARLTRAQGDLRAVLTVRQEAVAVMAGLLPP